MSNFLFSINVTIPIFLVMVIGYFLRRIGMLNENFVTVANTGRTALVVTHDPEFILRCCNYVLHLENGQIQESYSIEDSDGRKRLLKFFLSDMKKEVSTE